MSNDSQVNPYCGKCSELVVDEETQDRYKDVFPSPGLLRHFCRKYSRFVLHNGHHPYLVRLPECLADMEYTTSVYEHSGKVNSLMGDVVDDLEYRARLHDRSKLDSPEKEMFKEYTPKLKETVFGSKEYNDNKKEMGKALQHHYDVNRHHPEHFSCYICDECNEVYREPVNECVCCGSGLLTKQPDITQMSLFDLMEMMCDWIASISRQPDGNIYKSIEINQSRFNYSNDIKRILISTAKYFEDNILTEDAHLK